MFRKLYGIYKCYFNVFSSRLNTSNYIGPGVTSRTLILGKVRKLSFIGKTSRMYHLSSVKTETES